MLDQATPSSQEYARLILGDGSGKLCLAFINAAGETGHVFVQYPDQLADAVETIEEQAPEHNAYLAPALYRAKRRLKANVLDQVCCLWADLDECPPDQVWPRPSIALQSSPDRYQAYWLMDWPISTVEAENLNRKIAYAYRHKGADVSGWPSNKILRLPHTPNHKYPEKPQVEYVWFSRTRYRPSDFDALPEPPKRLQRGDAALPEQEPVSDKFRSRVEGFVRELNERIAEGRFIKEGPKGKSFSDARFNLLCSFLEIGLPPTMMQDATRECVAFDKDENLGLDLNAALAKHDHAEVTCAEGECENARQVNVLKLRDKSQPVEIHRKQMRFAQRFANAYADKFLFAHGGEWSEWTSTCWQECVDGAHVRATEALLKAAYAELGSLGKDDLKDLLSDIMVCSSAAGVRGILDLAKNFHPIAVPIGHLDANPYLFNTQSGTLNLATGLLQQHMPKDYITKSAAGAFDPSATSEVWDAFLERVLPDVEVRSFVQRLIGYSLLGVVREHVMPIFIGVGANGKGTLRDAVMSAFGDYALEVDPEILMESKHARHLTFLMELRGRRLVFCSETEKGRKFAESTMKRLVGGDPIQANRMHRDPITFIPSHTLIMMTNHLPEVSGDDQAVWRRILVVPFDVVIPEAERDEQLPERLKEKDVRSAVLAWAYQGFLDYQQRGLDAPEAVKVRTNEYQAESDPIGRFLRERTRPVIGAGVVATVLWEHWQVWCDEFGETTGTLTAFGRSMAARGVQKVKSHGQTMYKGLITIE